MAEVVIDERLIDVGEAYFAVYVDLPRGVGQTVVAELEMDLVGPVAVEKAKPRRLSGFELPAPELMQKAQERAAERGVRKILLVDPHGLLALTQIGNRARR